MKKLMITTAAAAWLLAAVSAFGAWVYEGEWSRGLVSFPHGLVAAPSGDVYIGRGHGGEVQRFTATGSILGSWRTPSPSCVWVRGVAANGDVYGRSTLRREAVVYFTSTGSYIGEWATAVGRDVAVAPNGSVYVNNENEGSISYHTPTGSLLGSWPDPRPRYLDVAPNGNVYIGAINGVRYYTGAGSFLGSWGSQGTGPGQFDYLEGIAVAPDGTVFTCERDTNNRVQYFTATGSYLGQWGSYGGGAGEFTFAIDVAVSRTGARVYVLEYTNRVQYFRWSPVAVTPASLGRVKALFR